MTILVANEINYTKLSNFSNLKEFNHTIEQAMLEIKSEFTKSELIALKRLIRYSAKVSGVCWAKIQTIVAATHKDTQGISRSTFERMLKKAESLGLIDVHSTYLNNKQKHNVYVFNKLERVVSKSNTIDVPKVEKLTHRKTINLLETSKNLKETYSIENVASKVTFYENMKNLLKATTGTTKFASRLFGIYKANTSKMLQFEVYKHDTERFEVIGYEALRITIRASKEKDIKNLPGFYSGVLNNLIDDFVLEAIKEESEVFEMRDQNKLNDMQHLFFQMIS